jgi:hypothetical protein
MNEEYKKMFKSLWLILKTMSATELNFFVNMPENNDFATYVFQPESIQNDWRIRYFEMSLQNKVLMAKFLNEMLSERLPSLWSRLFKKGYNYNDIRFQIDILENRQVDVNFIAEYYDTDESEDEYTIEDDSRLVDVFQSIRMLNPNISSAKLDFEGSGDSGSIDSDIVTNEGVYPVPKSVENWCYSILPGGWEINEGSYGNFYFDLETETVGVLVSENVEGSMEDTMFELSF